MGNWEEKEVAPLHPRLDRERGASGIECIGLIDKTMRSPPLPKLATRRLGSQASFQTVLLALFSIIIRPRLVVVWAQAMDRVFSAASISPLSFGLPSFSRSLFSIKIFVSGGAKAQTQVGEIHANMGSGRMKDA